MRIVECSPCTYFTQDPYLCQGSCFGRHGEAVSAQQRLLQGLQIHRGVGPPGHHAEEIQRYFISNKTIIK